MASRWLGHSAHHFKPVLLEKLLAMVGSLVALYCDTSSDRRARCKHQRAVPTAWLVCLIVQTHLLPSIRVCAAYTVSISCHMLSCARTGFVVFSFVFDHGYSKLARFDSVYATNNDQLRGRVLKLLQRLTKKTFHSATFVSGLTSCVLPYPFQKFFVLAACASWSSPEACRIASHRCTLNWLMICSSELRPQRSWSSCGSGLTIQRYPTHVYCTNRRGTLES